MQACAVIGCGPAGIVASTQLRQSGLLVTCFELAPGPGGIWLSNSRDLFSSRGLVSPIYPSMRCVLPKDLMSFSDVHFDYTVPQFPHHSAVRHYLEQSAEKKGVRGLTRFNTKVESVRFDERDGLWKLITVNVRNGDVMEWSFDKVCVCTGQTQEPRYPQNLKRTLAEYVREGGELHHSSHVKDFRSLRNKRVVVVGDGVSAYDYCMELKKYGADVHHSTTLTGSPAATPDGSEASISSVLFHEGRKKPPVRQGGIRSWRDAFFKKLPSSTGKGETTASAWDGEDQPSRTDLTMALTALAHRLPGRRGSTHEANEVIRLWLRYRSANMEGIPRMGAVVGCTEGRGLVLAPDPTRRVSTEEAVREARRRRLAGSAATEGDNAGDGLASLSGTHLSNVDAVVCATGYTQRFPFLHKDLRRVLEAETPLLLPQGQECVGIESDKRSRGVAAKGTAVDMQSRRGLYLGTLFMERPSLGFVGFQRELLPPFLLFEAQARFVAYAFSQRLTLQGSAAALRERESRLLEGNPMLRGLHSDDGLGLHSAAYYNVLEEELGISSRDTYTSKVMERHWWLSASSGLRVYHKLRSMAPLKRKEQHLLFSNKI